MISAQYIHTAKKAIFTALAVWLAAYVFVILLTYTPNDPSWSHINSDMGDISNMGGAAGAWTADILYALLGMPAWWIIVFFAYESLCVWWQRERTFGLLRVIGYLFLLLASCGLIEVIPQLYSQSDSSPSSYGGILGFEIANRLVGLLSTVGAASFLLLFVIITATFAFDIRWLSVLKSIVNLSWLGSGVRGAASHKVDDDLVITATTNEVPPSTLETDARYANSKNSDSSRYESLDERDDYQNEDEQKPIIQDTLTSTFEDKADPIFGQLPLQLPKSSASAIIGNNTSNNDIYAQGANAKVLQSGIDTSSRVLDEFLTSSGISDSVKEMQRQEAHDLLLADKPQALATNEHNQAAAVQPSSFTWNDQNVSEQDSVDKTVIDQSTLNKLLDEQITVINQQQPLDKVLERQSTEDIHGRTEPSVTILNTETPYQNDNLNSNDNLNDEIKISDGISINDDVTISEEVGINDNISINDNFSINDSITAPVEEAPQPKQNTIVPLSLTPTNTPPANPTEPPKATNDNSISSESPVTPTKPEKPAIVITPANIQFATPEDGGGNRIEEMVVDNDDIAEDSQVLPEIHDDTAFSSKSRSMQTAKYRSNLTAVPELSLLDKPDPDKKPSYNQAELKQLSELLEIKLQDFNVKADVVNAIPGPVVTRFEVELAPGIKASKVTGISRDLARSLSMASLRVVEVIPGKPYIGIEVPNKKREMVRLIELLHTKDYKDPKAQISMAMGKDIGGKPIITDLARAPHMLVAGTTGSGKSVLVNSMLLSMLLKYTPNELRLILIDPKQLELANYNDIPHLLTPVVTDMNEAASSLSWCVAEMERRYQLMSLLKVRKLEEFNKKVIAAQAAGRPMIDPLWRPNDSVSIDQAPKLKTLPMIVIVADEFADMIMQVGKQAEELITRLAQKSRAAGIHLILATQRPSVDVITGLIKANIPVRAALRVNSKVDSRTILDAGGAEDMLGNGDMLFLGPGQIEPERVHGAYVSDEEVNRICDAWRERGAPDYIDNMASNFELTASGSSGNTSGEDDELYDEAVAFVMETRKVSASSIQRKFSIGYNRAARIVDSMQEAGLVSAMGKSGKRELLM